MHWKEEGRDEKFWDDEAFNVVALKAKDWISLGKGLTLQIKELSFCWVLKLCPVATTDSTKSWPELLLQFFWPGENKWWAVKLCEYWHFISGVQISYHFLLLPFFLLPPLIYSSWEQCSCLVGVFLVTLREAGLGNTVCPSVPPQWWLSCAKEVLFLLLSQPIKQISPFNTQMTPKAKVHSQELHPFLDDSRSPLRWQVLPACASPAG